MSRRCAADRSAPPVFVPIAADESHDPDAEVRRYAVWALRRCSAIAARYADTLADIAAGYPAVAGERRLSTEYHAVKTLVLLGDPRWVEPVCTAAAAGHPAHYLTLSGARFSSPVFAEVRDRLGADPARADVLARRWRRGAPRRQPRFPSCSPRCRSRMRRSSGCCCRSVTMISLRYRTCRTRVTQTGDLRAATAVRRITGDTQPLHDALAAILSGGRTAPSTPVSFLSDLGDALLPVMPAARDHRTGTAARTYPRREAQILAARIVAAMDGPHSVLPTVRAVLDAGHTSARAAADLIADIAAAHQPALASLEPDLRNASATNGIGWRQPGRWHAWACRLLSSSSPWSEVSPTTPAATGSRYGERGPYRLQCRW